METRLLPHAVELTASSTKPPPADTGTPEKEGKKPDEETGDGPPDEAMISETTSTKACTESEAMPTPVGQHMGSHSSKCFPVKISMVIHSRSWL